MTDFDTLIEHIKADNQGTLIVICGRVGCGKSTLALKLMRSINGSDDMSYIVTQSDLMHLECCRSVPDVKAHLIEDVLDRRFMERACKLTTIGYVPIIAVADLYDIPRQYRAPSTKGPSSVLVIQFGGQRGEFKAIHSVLKGERLSTAEASGTVTQEDVDKVRRMTVQRMVQGAETPYRYEHGIASALSRGAFCTSNYGKRAEGSYGRNMTVSIIDGGLEFDIEGEYIFHLDMDVVEDLLKLIQKCKEKNMEEKK